MKLQTNSCIVEEEEEDEEFNNSCRVDIHHETASNSGNSEDRYHRLIFDTLEFLAFDPPFYPADTVRTMNFLTNSGQQRKRGSISCSVNIGQHVFLHTSPQNFNSFRPVDDFDDFARFQGGIGAADRINGNEPFDDEEEIDFAPQNGYDVDQGHLEYVQQQQERQQRLQQQLQASPPPEEDKKSKKQEKKEKKEKEKREKEEKKEREKREKEEK